MMVMGSRSAPSNDWIVDIKEHSSTHPPARSWNASTSQDIAKHSDKKAWDLALSIFSLAVGAVFVVRLLQGTGGSTWSPDWTAIRTDVLTVFLVVIGGNVVTVTYAQQGGCFVPLSFGSVSAGPGTRLIST